MKTDAIEKCLDACNLSVARDPITDEDYQKARLALAAHVLPLVDALEYTLDQIWSMENGWGPYDRAQELHEALLKLAELAEIVLVLAWEKQEGKRPVVGKGAKE